MTIGKSSPTAKQKQKKKEIVNRTKSLSDCCIYIRLDYLRGYRNLSAHRTKVSSLRIVHNHSNSTIVLEPSKPFTAFKIAFICLIPVCFHLHSTAMISLAVFLGNTIAAILKQVINESYRPL